MIRVCDTLWICDPMDTGIQDLQDIQDILDILVILDIFNLRSYAQILFLLSYWMI